MPWKSIVLKPLDTRQLHFRRLLVTPSICLQVGSADSPRLVQDSLWTCPTTASHVQACRRASSQRAR